MIQEEIRRKLAAERVRLGLTQAQLAKRMNVGPSTVSELERGGICNPPIDTVTRWASAVGLGLKLIDDPMEIESGAHLPS